jgi:MFS family permease
MSPLVRFIIFSTVFVKGGSFISLPFLTVYLQKHFGASPTMTGFIVGLNPTAGLLIGFAGGYLSDIWGRKGILLTSMVLCTLSYFSFGIATEVWHFALGSIVLGAATGALQTSLRALISDITAPKVRPKAFRLQYFAVNVGASVGPLVGAALLLSDFTKGFAITGSLYFLYFITFLLFDKFSHNPVFEEIKTKTSFHECIKILKKDTAFLLLVVGSILLALCYSQIDTLLPQYLRNHSGDEGIKTYSWLLAANSLTVMLGLYPAIWAAEKLGAMGSVIWGQIIMGIGFAAMAFVGSSAIPLILCMVFLTIGEVFAFSNWSVVVDSYAKPGLKGSYFGASGFHMIGNSIGPLVGGYLYQTGGSYLAFCLLGLSAIAGVFFYKKAESRRTPQHKKVLAH